MAYLNKGDTVVIRSGNITARVEEIQWRRFRRSAEEIARMKRRNPNRPVKLTKSVPYAICKVFMGDVPAGTEFLIPGYKLKSLKKDGETILILDTKWAAEFDGAWVKKILEASNAKRAGGEE